MLKRLLLYLVVLAVLLALAFSADQGDHDTVLLQQHAAEISAYLNEQETAALAWARAQRGALTSGRVDAAGLPESADYTVLLHRGDSILFWSASTAMPTRRDLKAWGDRAGRSLRRLPLGYFSVYQEDFGEGRTLAVLVPVRYTLGAARGAGPFPADAGIPETVMISTGNTPYFLEVGGAPLAYLQAEGPVHSAWLQWAKLLALALCMAVVLALLKQGADFLAARVRPAAGLGALIASVVLLIFLNNQLGLGQGLLGALPAFSQTFAPPTWLGKSLGDWLFSVFLIAWLLVYAPRGLRDVPVTPANQTARLGVNALFYLLYFAGLLLTQEAARQLMFHAGLHLDFNNILSTTPLGWAALGGMTLLMAALFLFSHRLLLRVRALGLTRGQRLPGLAAGLAMLLAGQFALAAEHQLPLLELVGLGLFYGLVFEAFCQGERPDFAWLGGWILAYSLFTAVVFYRYNSHNDQQQRREYVRALAAERDTTWAEPALKRLHAAMLRDSQAINNALNPWPFKPAAADVRGRLVELLYRENYLFQHYRLLLYVYDRERLPLLREQTLPYGAAIEAWNAGAPLPESPGIRYRETPEGKFQYMLRLDAWRMGDPTQPAELFCFFEHEYPQPSRVYSQLFYDKPYKQLTRLAAYDFTVQRNGRLIAEHGQGNAAALNAKTTAGEVLEVENDGAAPRVDVVLKNADNNVAAVGRTQGGRFKLIYLFALLSTLNSLLLFLLAFANGYLKFLPTAYELEFSTRGSLAKRIHYYTIALLGAAFLVVGFLTYNHFTRAAQDAERANLNYRAEVITTNLKAQTLNPGLDVDSLRRALPTTLAPLAASLNMDVNFYTPAGDLAFTTREDLGQLGILAGKMNPAALKTLSSVNQTELGIDEKINGHDYLTQYVSLRNGEGQLLGFLGIPSQIAARAAGAEVSDFIGRLASLYLFLLLIAYAATYVLARSIIRPISLISEKIRVLRLDNRNQPLDYKGGEQDELSDLIDEYNTMVDKLEDSKVKMIRLEREGAWREMARQVAHDIKNPLTTMKLSMQQLERVSSNPEQAATYLRKAITRLIEQIDSLAQIASEFSMFANLDIRQKHDLVINEVVESVYDLFSEQKNVDLALNLPRERYHIQGDKNHLIRVFNNLVINAIQAIPSDRRGNIRVTLKEDNDKAIVQISDNGGGIPPEIRDRVFEPNFTTKTSGSGLGLAICRKIIEAHDGNIFFETREGEGTDFFIEIPITGYEVM